MKVNKLKKICFLFLGISFSTIYAQESSVAAGGDATGSGGSIAYSVGQVVYTTITGSNGTISQGVQQPYDIYTVGVNTLTNINLEASTYPNPTVDYITLKISDYDLSALTYQVYDINGKLIESKKIVANQSNINLSALAAATYMVKVIGTNNQELKSFKVIKN